jgi:hypothetical protein
MLTIAAASNEVGMSTETIDDRYPNTAEKVRHSIMALYY